MSDFRCSFDVSHRNSLATYWVVCDTGEYEWNVFWTYCKDEFFEFFKVHVAFEWVLFVSAAFWYFVKKFFVVKVSWDGAHLFDVTFCCVEVTVGRNCKHFTWVTFCKDFLNDFHKNGFSCTTLLDDKCVWSFHLCCAAVEETAFVFTEVEFVHEFVYVFATCTDKVDCVFPVLFAAAFKDITECVEKYVVTVVTAVCFVTEHKSGPLKVCHSCCTGVGEHVNCKHTSWECEFIPVCCVECSFTLFYCNFWKVTNCVCVRMWCSCFKWILFHW